MSEGGTGTAPAPYVTAFRSQTAFTRVAGAEVAWLACDGRGTLVVRGADRMRFLAGMLTSDVARLGMLRASPSLWLSRKGRVLATLYVIVLEDCMLLDLAPGTRDVAQDGLSKYVIADDVAIEAREGDAHAALEGPGSGERLHALGHTVPAQDEVARIGPDLLLIGGGYATHEGVRILGPRGEVARLRAALDVAALEPAQADLLRIAAFVPQYGVDVSEQRLPHEARLESAISFTKGCFVGQEIVARVRSRGGVHRFLSQIHLERPPAAETRELFAGDRRAGEITSQAVCPDGSCLALGYLGESFAAVGTEVTAGAIRGFVVGPTEG
jgi:folate-binding protein YgfZ